MIEKAMKQIHFSVKSNKSNKQQALEVIKALKAVIPIERANMKLKVVTSKKNKSQIEQLASQVEKSESLGDGTIEMVELVCFTIDLAFNCKLFFKQTSLSTFCPPDIPDRSWQLPGHRPTNQIDA